VNRILFFGILAVGVVASAEDRFGRPVVKLANPQAILYYKVDGNNIPYFSKDGVTVSCMTYRGTQRYYVEVGVSNHLSEPVPVSRDFVNFTKPGYTVIATSTLSAVEDLVGAAAVPFVRTPPPPPTKSTTVYDGNSTTYGDTTQANGRATTTTDNSAAGWHALGEAIGARRYYNNQRREQSFANYLQMFAHERQDLIVQPGKANIYMYTFEQIKQKKSAVHCYSSSGCREVYLCL
jgi:hypothetical protein